jgi:hypothetical protein
MLAIARETLSDWLDEGAPGRAQRRARRRTTVPLLDAPHIPRARIVAVSEASPDTAHGGGGESDAW